MVCKRVEIQNKTKIVSYSRPEKADDTMKFVLHSTILTNRCLKFLCLKPYSECQSSLFISSKQWGLGAKRPGQWNNYWSNETATYFSRDNMRTEPFRNFMSLESWRCANEFDCWVIFGNYSILSNLTEVLFKWQLFLTYTVEGKRACLTVLARPFRRIH